MSHPWIPPPKCQICSGIIRRNSVASSREQWRKRKYCSQPCQTAGQKAERAAAK